VDSELSGGSYDERTNVLTLSGEWDFAGKVALRTLTSRLQSSSKASIDLCAVRFMDSSVINEIFHTSKRLTAAGGRLRLIVGDERIERLLRITQVDRVIDISHSHHNDG
jgi:anti-anti-sigma factor